MPSANNTQKKPIIEKVDSVNTKMPLMIDWVLVYSSLDSDTMRILDIKISGSMTHSGFCRV